MRLLFLFVAFVVGLNASAGDKPEAILPRTAVIKPQDWYVQQSALWEAETRQNPGDAGAWLNYYSASRFGHTDRATLDAILASMNQTVGNTFEYYLAAAMHSGANAEGFSLVEAAYALRPESPATYGALALMYEFKGVERERKAFSQRLFHSGLVAPSLLNYSYNVLMSVPEEALLITDSDNTTLPILLLQDVMNIRQDVAVLDLDLLVNEEYRNRRLSGLGLILENTILATKAELSTLLPRQNPSRQFYFALTVARENLVNLKDQLYVVGLASQASASRIDNIESIRSNLENRFLMDYLVVDFNGESIHSAGRVLSANYLVPMLLLLDRYRELGEKERADDLESTIVRIAQGAGKSALVRNFLRREGETPAPIVPAGIDVKTIEGIFRPVFKSVYAQEYEVTNKQYNEFLEYLSRNNMNELYEKCRIHLDQYEEPALSFMKGYHSNRIPTRKEKYFSRYPVVNISFEAAQAYCEWLTDQYNNTAGRKYRKVRFRLPSLEEWQLAAAGLDKPSQWGLDGNTAEVKIYEDGKEMSRKFEKKEVSLSNPEILYPWFTNWNFRNRDLNGKGCALGNFKYPEDQRPCVATKMNTADGFLLMSPVQAYFPNGIGLYDVVGNVAEMVNEKGKACGGSWNHAPSESTIRTINTYDAPAAEIGFRVFMEVLEK